jgi:hypothetical protein
MVRMAAAIGLLGYWLGRRSNHRSGWDDGMIRGFSMGLDIGQLATRQSVVDCLDEMEGDR